MSIAFVTDSTSDLTPEIIGRRPIAVVPCYVNVDGKSRLDGVELSRAEFYRDVATYRSALTTSAPSVGAFAEAYRRLAAQGASAIVAIPLASGLGNNCNVARLAATGTPEIPVTVFDSGQLSLGIGHMVLAAADAGLAGAPLAEILTRLESMRQRSFSFGVIATLEYLQRGGRLSWMQAGLGSLLKIKPLLRIHGGSIDIDKPRTMGKAIERMFDLVSGMGRLERLSLVHTQAEPEIIVGLRRLVGPLTPASAGSLLVEASPAIGVHLGPGAVGLCVVAAA